MLWTAWFLALGCLAAAAPAGPDQRPSPAAGSSATRLLITGSSTMFPMVTEIVKRFQARHPTVIVDVQSGGSGRGLSDVRQGKVDIGMVSRALTEKEADLYGFPIARDGVCLVIHRDNPVQALTNRQIVDIYTGKITNWKGVGGRDAPITVMNAEAARSSAELFTQYFDIKYSDIRPALVLGDNPERIKTIVADPNGIVYISVGEAERTALAGTPIKLLPMDGVAPTSRNIRTGDYPIQRALTLVTKTIPAGLAKDFINFALSPEVTDIARKHDFVPYLD